jgi:cytochrome P450
MNQPDIAAKLCDEITTQVGTRAPSHDDFKTMEYLNGCVHETLRLHPSVPGSVVNLRIISYHFMSVNDVQWTLYCVRK